MASNPALVSVFEVEMATKVPAGSLRYHCALMGGSRPCAYLMLFILPRRFITPASVLSCLVSLSRLGELVLLLPPTGRCGSCVAPLESCRPLLTVMRLSHCSPSNISSREERLPSAVEGPQ